MPLRIGNKENILYILVTIHCSTRKKFQCKYKLSSIVLNIGQSTECEKE